MRRFIEGLIITLGIFAAYVAGIVPVHAQSVNQYTEATGTARNQIAVVPVGLSVTTTARLLSAAATTNSTLVKGSAGYLFKITGTNVKAGFVYLKLYNKATAPICGTDTPVVTIAIPASTTFNYDFNAAQYFPLGIGYCITGAAADADATALVAGDVVAMNVFAN